MEIIEKKEHPLLSRTEIIAKDSYTGATPSRNSIKDRLAIALKSNKEFIVIKHIYPEFGFGTAKIIAYLYLNKKDMERIEPEYAFKKGISKKEEEKKQDKPKSEEKKEEVKPEQGKEKPAEQKKQGESKPEQKKPEQKQEGKKKQSPEKPLEEKKS